MDDRAVIVSESLGIDHIDLKPHLEMSRATFYDFYHYTPKGALKLGEAVADHLLQMKTPAS